MSRVLVVDSDPKVRRAVDHTLTRAGYQVEIASTPAEATRRVQHTTMDVALVGQVTGGRSGALAERLRSLQPSCLRLLMTSSQDANTRDALERGVAVASVPRQDQAQLVQRLADAQQAARRLSALGQSQFIASREVERHQLLSCVDCDLLRIALQPVVRTSDRLPIAYESLLRSSHPVLHTPHAVFAVAARHRLLPIIATQISHLAALSRPLDALLSLNLHLRQLHNPGQLVKSLEPLMPFASQVLLEIPAVSPVEQVAPPTAERLRDLGFRLALDHVGPSDCLLPALAELRPSQIKLDMALVRDVHLHSGKQRRISVIVGLAEAIGAQVVGQGVESEQEVLALQRLGVSLLQGFLIGRPKLQTPGRVS